MQGRVYGDVGERPLRSSRERRSGLESQYKSIWRKSNGTPGCDDASGDPTRLPDTHQAKAPEVVKEGSEKVNVPGQRSRTTTEVAQDHWEESRG